MILAIDVGNTNIKLALYDHDEMVMSWRLSNRVNRTADEFGIEFGNLFGAKGYRFDQVEGIIMSSVVPGCNYTITHACRHYMGLTPMMVDTTIKTGLTFAYTNPHSLGADRIANAVGAVCQYGAPVIVIDMGTATTFGVVDRNRCFVGGCIAPGIKSSVDALSNQASQLPLVELETPKHIIATDTISNIQAGVIHGFRGLVKEIVLRLKEELNDPQVKVVVTGGLAELVNDPQVTDIYDRALTLKGLYHIYKLNH